MLARVDTKRDHDRALSLSEGSGSLMVIDEDAEEYREAVRIGEWEDAVDVALREELVRWVSGSSEEIDVTVVDVVDVALREQLVRWVSGRCVEMDSVERDVVTVVVLVVEELE